MIFEGVTGAARGARSRGDNFNYLPYSKQNQKGHPNQYLLGVTEKIRKPVD